MYSKESIKPDIVKKEYDGVEFNILGIEIQDKVHYAMPLRTMIYDGLGYLKEYNELKSKNRYTSGMTSDEFLSGMKKDNNNCAILFRDAVGRSCQYKRYDDTYETRDRKYIYRL